MGVFTLSMTDPYLLVRGAVGPHGSGTGPHPHWGGGRHADPHHPHALAHLSHWAWVAALT